MNGAIYDATNVFWKLKYMKTYDAVLSTPIEPADVAVGETAWRSSEGSSTRSRSWPLPAPSA